MMSLPFEAPLSLTSVRLSSTTNVSNILLNICLVFKAIYTLYEAKTMPKTKALISCGYADCRFSNVAVHIILCFLPTPLHYTNHGKSMLDFIENKVF